MTSRSFDAKTFTVLFVPALLGAAWAVYQRGLTAPPYPSDQVSSLVWVIFAVPFALFWGWFFARPRERWLAAFVCFCIYFFSPFLAARYESCTITSGTFSLVSCFADSQGAQDLAGAAGHRIYFDAVVIIHVIAAAVTAVQRARARPTAAPGVVAAAEA